MTDGSKQSDRDREIRFGEAMLTFRAVMTASVPTVTALFAGTITIVGFAVGDDVNGALLMVAAAPMLAMVFLFCGWRWYNGCAADEAEESEIGAMLAKNLGTKPGKWLIFAPGIVASLLLGSGVCSIIRSGDDQQTPKGSCVIEPPASGQCMVPGG